MTLADSTIASGIADALPAMRWFADKGADILRVTLHDRIPLPRDAAVEVVMADVRLADVHPAGTQPMPRYVMLLDAAGGDTAAMPEVAQRLLDVVLAGRSLPGRNGTLVGHPAGLASPGPTGAVTVQAIGGDASNTSLVVRSSSAGWIIKLLRRCREGIQPEVEIGEFFATRSPWPDTPRFCGWLEYLPEGGGPGAASTAVATVHAFAPGHTTGWDRLVGLLIAGGGLSGGSRDAMPAIVAALGRVTARMHRALAARHDIPSFAPAPATPAGLRAAATRMDEHGRRVFDLIESRLPQLEPTIAGRLAAVSAARSRLVDRFACLPDIALATSAIRVHGDYHLGQVLVADTAGTSLATAQDDGVLVIDFEGEPGRTLAERREKTAAAKDVAGMCRSFDYLLRHVAKSTGRPYVAADLERLENCYLDAYRELAAGQPWWPADRGEADALLAVFKLDKALYELAYELTNRPDWIDVPLAAIEEAVATAVRTPA